MTRRNLAAAALAVLVLPVATVAVAAWAQIPTNERWFLAYILICLIPPTVTLVALMTGVGYLIRGCARALARRQDRRIARHVDTALAHLTDPPTQVIQLGAAETQVLARYEREVADLTEFYVFPEEIR